MVISTGRIKDRLKHLLAYFAKEYVKAYKTALVLHIRDQKNAKQEEGKPDWHLMLDNSFLIKNPQLEGEVYVGDGLKKKVKWSMARNYVVTETPIEESKDKKEATPADATGSPPQSPTGAASPTSPDGSSSSVAPADEKLRVWLDDSCANNCMNPACGEKFSFTKRRTHCRHCGEIFCSKCTGFKIGDNKFCEACYTIRKEAADPSTLPPVLERPKIKIRMLNFYKYKVSLHDSELFANAGAGAAAAKVKLPEGAEGKFLLILTHKRSTRPQLTVAFDDKEERDKWQGLIKSAAIWSPAPITLDPVLRKTFTQAYNRTRWYAWVWSSWDIDGSESEMLADLMYDVLEREIFGAELSKLGNLPRQIAKKSIIGMLEAAVSACWSGLQKGLAEVRVPIEKAAEGMLGPLFEKEVELKEKVKQPISEGATKALENAQEKLQEMFEEKIPVIGAAGEAELNLIHSSLAEFVKEWEGEANKSGSNFSWKYDWVRWRGDWLYAFKQKPISIMIDTKLADEEASGPSIQLAQDLNNDMKALNQSAFIVIRRDIDVDNDPIGQLKERFPDIIRRAAHDMAIILQIRLVKALDSTLRPPLIEVMKKIVETICEPLTSLIPELLKDILDPERTCMEIISDILGEKEKELITIAIKRVVAGVIDQGEALANQGLVLKE